MKANWEISTADLEKAPFELIDIRELAEIEQNPCLRPYTHNPMSDFDPTLLKPHVNYALFCARGRRSHMLTQQLREMGVENVFSLLGGISSLQM